MTPTRQQAELLRTSEAIAWRRAQRMGQSKRWPDILGPRPGLDRTAAQGADNAEIGRWHLRAALRVAEARAQHAAARADLFSDLFTHCPACRAGLYDHADFCPQPATAGGYCVRAVVEDARPGTRRR